MKKILILFLSVFLSFTALAQKKAPLRKDMNAEYYTAHAPQLILVSSSVVMDPNTFEWIISVHGSNPVLIVNYFNLIYKLTWYDQFGTSMGSEYVEPAYTTLPAGGKNDITITKTKPDGAARVVVDLSYAKAYMVPQ